MASTITADNGVSSGSAGLKSSADSSGVLALATGTGTTAVTIDTSQNVGIGTSSPSRRLQVQTATTGNVDAISWSDNSTDTGYLGIASGGGARLWAGGFLALGAGGGASFTERARIDSSGNLLVGTTSSGLGGLYTNKLNLDATGSSGIGVKISAANSSYGLSIWNAATTGQRLVGFYAGSSITSVGAIESNGTTTSYLTSSDYRLKENIAPMVGGLSIVQQLKPRTYTWKADGSAGQGFIAHELQAVVPDCVTGEKDAVETYTDEEGNEQLRPKYQGIDTSFLVATLTAAIQELNAKFEEYKAAHP